MTKEELRQFIISRGWKEIEDYNIFKRPAGGNEFISLWKDYLGYSKDEVIYLTIPYERITTDGDSIELPDSENLYISIDL